MSGDLPEVKLKALVNFPASAIGRTGIKVTKDGGKYFLDLDYDGIQATPTIPADDMPNAYNLIWDEVKKVFWLVPFALQATAGVSSLAGHIGALDIGEGLQFTGETLETGDDLIHYTPPGTGAEVRTVRSRLRDQLSVFDFIPPSEHAAIQASTSTYDASSDINAAIEAANGQPLYMPAGKFRLLSPLIRNASATDFFRAGLILRGAGMLSTILEYAGATTDVGVIHLKTANFVGVKFTLGSEFEDFGIQQVGGATGVDGIRLTAAWMATFRRLNILSMKQHAIHVPYCPEFDDSGSGGFSTGSDVYQDLYPTIEHCRLDGCGGWGVRFEGGNAAGPFYVAHNQFVNCIGGGMYTEVGQGTVENNVFTGCGQLNGDPALTGGFISDNSAVEDDGPTPFALLLFQNEFDTNNIQHIRMKGAVNAVLDSNRFISNVVGGVMTPNAHIALGRLPESKSAITTECRNNAHRSPIDSSLAITWYDGESAFNTTIINPLDILSGSGRVKYASLDATNGSTIIEGNKMLIGPEPPVGTGSAALIGGGATINVCTVNVPPGPHDILASVIFDPAGSTSVTVAAFSISPTSGVHITNAGQYHIDRRPAWVPGGTFGGETVALRVNPTVTTTYYLTASGTFTVSTMSASGIISARKVNR